MAYELAIEVFGTGEDPKHRSHWGFAIYKPSNPNSDTSPVGDLLEVQVIDLDRLWYQFEARMGTPLNANTMAAIGLARVGDLSEQQRRQAIAVIRSSPAPRDGKRRCQDWVYETLLALEIEEFVPDGTCHFWAGMIGKTARAVAETPGLRWTALK